MNAMIDAAERAAAREDFLKAAGWARADARALAGDASTRSYQRLSMDGRNAVLMIAPPGAEAPACPPSASDDDRRALGYNAMARLAGPNLNAFVTLSAALRDAGLSAPEVYAADARAGFALLEDLGDDLFARVVGRIDEEELYGAAMDALALLHESGVSAPRNDAYAMLDYDRLALEAEAMLLIEWYWPLKKGAPAPADAAAEYQAAWRSALAGLSAPGAMVLRDFHAENLLWLPSRAGVARVGVIDFQDGLWGQGAYDAASLLEDARRDVAPALAERMLVRYLERSGADSGAYLADYALLAAQRNAKILGIFARLARRDNKPRYLDLLPRVEGHFRQDLKRAGLGPVREFLRRRFPELAA